MPDKVEGVEEPTAVETKTEASETVAGNTAAETTTHVEKELLNSDAFATKVADMVFDRMKTFTGALTDAQEVAQQIAAEMIPIDQGPPPDAAPPEQITPPPDAKPERRHNLFGQPFKKKNQ